MSSELILVSYGLGVVVLALVAIAAWKEWS